ncbi:hypothetical protein FA95DRAFT_1574570 [Auriscalpium vulgare]|uniref:Uncharacterized protein n=1 Tax=Auriscalpium vulgare TaxID=40419 RepID=A0ACB8RLA5_9AGAM|nr:hypothetical protein FA95DRAFT_1574570 [Auriscalpium vulgare]
MPHILLKHILALFRSLWLRTSALLQTAAPTDTDLEAATTAPPATRPRCDRRPVPASPLPRNSHARNLKTKARLLHRLKKPAKASKRSALPVVVADLQAPSPHANTAPPALLGVSTGHTLLRDSVAERAHLGAWMSTPVLSPTHTISPTLSTESSLPPTPYAPSPDEALYPAPGTEHGGSSLAERRNFRGGKVFTSPPPIRSFSSSLSPLSPFFTSGGAGIRRLSSFVGRTTPSPPVIPGPDFEDADPFSTYGQSYIQEDVGVAIGNIYDISHYNRHVPARSSVRSNRHGAAIRTPPRSKPVNSGLNIYGTSIFGPFEESKPAYVAPPPSPTGPTTPKDRRVRAAENARKRRAMYQAHGIFSFSSPVLPSIPHTAPLSMSPSPSVRASLRSTTEDDPETLADRDYLRSIARARFTSSTDGSARSSVGSLFAERRQSTGLRPLILPQKLGLQTRPPSETEARTRDYEEALPDTRRRSPQLDDIISLLDASLDAENWLAGHDYDFVDAVVGDGAGFAL